MWGMLLGFQTATVRCGGFLVCGDCWWVVAACLGWWFENWIVDASECLACWGGVFVVHFLPVLLSCGRGVWGECFSLV